MGPHGPILRQFHRDAVGALHHPEVGDFDLTADVAAKLRNKAPGRAGDLQGFISGLEKTRPCRTAALFSCATRRAINPPAFGWISTGYRNGGW